MSLYNLERPQLLSEVMGQDKVVAQVKAILQSGKVPNVSLFVGPRGTGKTTVARILARALNCEHSTEDGPCNSCAVCKDILGEHSMDVIEIDAASHNKVEDVHGIIEGSKYAPLGRYKIYIIDEVHMLSIAAFNALLKLFEEPPAGVKFILCTTEEHKVPLTIISRCRKFYFEKISYEVIEKTLARICGKYNVPFEETALKHIAKASDGCMRDAESILDVFIDAGEVTNSLVMEILGVAQDEAVFSIIEAIISGNATDCVTLFREQTKKGTALSVLAKAMVSAITDTIYYIQAQDKELVSGSESYMDCVETLSHELPLHRAFELLNAFTDLFSAIQKINNDFTFESKMLSMIGYESSLSKAFEEIEGLKKETEALYEALEELSSSQSMVVSAGMADDVTTVVQQMPNMPTVSEEKEEYPQISTEEPAPYIPCEEYVDFGNSFENNELPSGFDNIPTMQPTPFDTDVLPGDISIPAGTELKGTISIFSETPEPVSSEPMDSEVPFENSVIVPNTEETPVAEESIKEEEIPSLLDNDLFSAFARQW